MSPQKEQLDFGFGYSPTSTGWQIVTRVGDTKVVDPVVYLDRSNALLALDKKTKQLAEDSKRSRGFGFMADLEEVKVVGRVQ